MDRRGFLGLLTGVPFIAGWASKLDSSGKRTVEVIEPIRTSGLAQAFSGDSDTSVSTTTVTNDGDTTMWVTMDGIIETPWTYTAG